MTAPVTEGETTARADGLVMARDATAGTPPGDRLDRADPPVGSASAGDADGSRSAFVVSSGSGPRERRTHERHRHVHDVAHEFDDRCEES